MIRKMYFKAQAIPFLGSLLRLANSFRKILAFKLVRLKSGKSSSSFDQKLDRFGAELISKYGTPQMIDKRWPPDAE